MPFAAELESALREFAAGGPAELRDDGSRFAPLSTLPWEVRGSPDKPMLHPWSENHNLKRRVLAITDHSEQRLPLAVECSPGVLRFRETPCAECFGVGFVGRSEDALRG